MKFCIANKKNIDAIIIWKIDRLTRDIKDFYKLQEFFTKLNIRVYLQERITEIPQPID